MYESFFIIIFEMNNLF